MAKQSARKKPPAPSRPSKARRAKRVPPQRKSAPAVCLPPLTGIARDLFTHVLNSIAFENYGDCCAVDDLAAKFGKTTGRLRPAVRRLVEQGYVTVEGRVFPIIYPTVAALRQQDPKLTVPEAKAILAKARRA